MNVSRLNVSATNACVCY